MENWILQIVLDAPLYRAYNVCPLKPYSKIAMPACDTKLPHIGDILLLLPLTLNWLVDIYIPHS